MTSCTVIIPVGPGHQEIAQQALASVQAASELPGDFDEINVMIGDDTDGKRGRSATRNAMVRGIDGHPPKWSVVFSNTDEDEEPKALETEWLFFLDADDLMCSPGLFGNSAFEVASKYLDDYDAIWGNIYELHNGGQVVRRKQTATIKSYSAYVKTPPMLSCQMGHFVRRSRFTKFDESVDVCEDIRWYLYAWKNLRCIKQADPLFLNRRGAHTWTGKQIEGARHIPNGREWSLEAHRLMDEARKEYEEEQAGS